MSRHKKLVAHAENSTRVRDFPVSKHVYSLNLYSSVSAHSKKQVLEDNFVLLYDENRSAEGKDFRLRTKFFASHPIDSGSLAIFVMREKKNIRNQSS